MNDNQIEQVKQILTEWNPLGGFAANVPDLNNYDTEAKDLAIYIDKRSSVKKIDQILTEILEEAFDFPLNLEESVLFASKIKSII